MLISPVHSMFSKVFSGFRLEVVLACIDMSPTDIIWQNLHYTISSDTSNSVFAGLLKQTPPRA